MAHPEREHELMIEVAHFRREVEIAMQALATTLRERDAEKAARVRAVEGEKAWCAAAQKAESERDALRTLLRGCRPLVAKAHVEADEGTEEGWFDFLRRIDAALAAPADGDSK